MGSTSNHNVLAWCMLVGYGTVAGMETCDGGWMWVIY